MKKLIDKKLLQFVLLFYTACFLVSTLTAFLMKYAGRYTSVSWGELFMNSAINYSVKLSFILVGVFLSRYIFIRNKAVIFWSIIIHGLLSLFLSFYSQFGQIVLSNWIFNEKSDLTLKHIYERGVLGIDYNFFIYFSVITMVYAYYYFQKQKDFQLKESQLKSQLLDSKIHALQSQLQPHFLFNTLNDISSLIDISSEKSQNAIADLSDLLRLTLQINDSKFISLKDELNLLNKYLDIEKMRYNEKMNYAINIEGDLLQEMVPPLLLQPILENSLKHGFSIDHDELDIRLRIVKKKEYLQFYIKNDGKTLENEELNYGTGISNIIKRMDSLYDGNFTFEIKTNPETKNGVINFIEIPLQ